jgi:hypothetical protein
MPLGQRFAQAQAQAQAALARGEEGLEQARQRVGRDARAAVAHRQLRLRVQSRQCAASACARRRGTRSSACSALVSRLCTICSSATGSAAHRQRGACRRTCGLRHAQPLAARAAAGTARGAARRPGARAAARPRCRRRALDQAAQPAHHVGGAARLRGGVRHGLARGGQVGRSSASRRCAACVLASSAVSGWFSSCAMPAAELAQRVQAPTWPRRSSCSARRRSARWRCTAAASAASAPAPGGSAHRPGPAQPVRGGAGARQGLCDSQPCVGPGPRRRSRPLHPQDLRVHRGQARQALFGGGCPARACGCSRARVARHGVVLHRALAQQAVGTMRASVSKASPAAAASCSVRQATRHHHRRQEARPAPAAMPEPCIGVPIRTWAHCAWCATPSMLPRSRRLAWYITDSVGLLSDAMESFVNLASALFALVMVTIAAAPGRRPTIPTATTRPSTFRPASKVS